MSLNRSVQLTRFYGCLREVKPDLSLPLLTTLFAIECFPGMSINDLAEAVDIPQQTASRYISVLQGRYQPLGSDENFFAKEPLVEITISSEDPRRRAVKTTQRGREQIDTLLKIMFKGLSDG